MNCKVIRKRTAAEIKFYTKDHAFEGHANLTFGFRRRMIEIVHSVSGKKLSFRQKNLLLKLINSLPVLNLESFTPYILEENLQLAGSANKVRFKPYFHVKYHADEFLLYLHNKNVLSVIKNDSQIAIMKRDTKSTNETVLYNLDYDKNASNDLQMLILLCALADIHFYSINGEIAFMKWETNIVIHDKHEHYSKWNPKE